MPSLLLILVVVMNIPWFVAWYIPGIGRKFRSQNLLVDRVELPGHQPPWPLLASREIGCKPLTPPPHVVRVRGSPHALWLSDAPACAPGLPLVFFFPSQEAMKWAFLKQSLGDLGSVSNPLWWIYYDVSLTHGHVILSKLGSKISSIWPTRAVSEELPQVLQFHAVASDYSARSSGMTPLVRMIYDMKCACSKGDISIFNDYLRLTQRSSWALSPVKLYKLPDCFPALGSVRSM